MTIAVAGGTGRLGTQVVNRLVADGLPVRVLTREPERARHFADLPVDVVRADVRDRAGIRAALGDATTVVSAVHGFAGPGRVSPASVDRDGNANLIDAAAKLGAHFVLMSVVGAAADHPMELFRAKHAAEQYLRASGTAWTIVRSTAFIELWAEILAKGVIFGRGTNPINFVSVTDVAAAVERAATDPGSAGKVVEVGGPRNLTFNELATLLQQSRGTSSKVRHVPRTLLRLIAPVSRQARAAVTMDTIDMTFEASPQDDHVRGMSSRAI